MSQKPMNVDPSKIEVPAALYPRARQPEEKDVEHLREVEPFHKIVTARGGKVLVDGAHRRLAAILDGKSKVEVLDLGAIADDEIIREGIKRNATHGKQLSLAEKRASAVKMVGDMSQGDMAKLFAVSERTVSRWVGDQKATLKENAIAKAQRLLDKGKSLTAIAKELGISRSTLSGWLKEAEEAPANPEPKPEPKPKSKKESKPSGVEPDPAVTIDDLVDENQEWVNVEVEVFINNCKAQVKKDENPDGLHWSDLARIVMAGVTAAFPKSAQ